MTEDLPYRIRLRAYELWERAGKPPGTHLHYWLTAEGELLKQQGNDDTEREIPADANRPMTGNTTVADKIR